MYGHVLWTSYTLMWKEASIIHRNILKLCSSQCQRERAGTSNYQFEPCSLRSRSLLADERWKITAGGGLPHPFSRRTAQFRCFTVDTGKDEKTFSFRCCKLNRASATSCKFKMSCRNPLSSEKNRGKKHSGMKSPTHAQSPLSPGWTGCITQDEYGWMSLFSCNNNMNICTV